MQLGGALIGPATNAECDEFLNAYKPSAADQKYGPWYWVQFGKEEDGVKAEKPAEDLEEGDSNRVKLEKKGKVLVDDLVKQCQHIKDTAPVRSNKAKKLRSQKELREEEYVKFNEEVAKIAKECGIITGKWLFYPTPESVDILWSKIVKALAVEDGVLAQTGAVHTAKVSTTPGDSGSYVICVYCDDSWDKETVGKVFKTLVEDLNCVSSAYKIDAFTILGIDSKHPSGVGSSLYGKNDFMTREEIDESLSRASKAKAAKKNKTLEEEQALDGEGFDPASESEDEERPRKKARN
ncbi:translation Initiation factor eIF-4e-like domain protein [Rhodotorula toruloides]|uniref:Translation Initiation factor eIF-4e-like domain protein n=1 Tax=Rhodotorula toruloides TaxID=5286 RepID=A0A511KEG7_RHOTO|nr:translation Initiation factor eIF-4e-like domain protein [Rhodotorula toruloides]